MYGNRVFRPQLIDIGYIEGEMPEMTAILRGIGATLVSVVISIGGFLLFGVFLPVWTMMLIHGRQNVQDAPAHGGIILLVTLPIAGLLALCGFFILTPVVYRRLSTRHGR
jgi:hypothetical protein